MYANKRQNVPIYLRFKIEANVLALAMLTIILWLGFACKSMIFLMALREVMELLFACDRLGGDTTRWVIPQI